LCSSQRHFELVCMKYGDSIHIPVNCILSRCLPSTRDSPSTFPPEADLPSADLYVLLRGEEHLAELEIHDFQNLPSFVVI